MKRWSSYLGYIGFIGLLGLLFGSPHLYGFFGFFGFFCLRPDPEPLKDDLHTERMRRLDRAI